MMVVLQESAAADKADDLDGIAVRENGRIKLCAGDDGKIPFHRDAADFVSGLLQLFGDGFSGRIDRGTVDGYHRGAHLLYVGMEIQKSASRRITPAVVCPFVMRCAFTL